MKEGKARLKIDYRDVATFQVRISSPELLRQTTSDLEIFSSISCYSVPRELQEGFTLRETQTRGRAAQTLMVNPDWYLSIAIPNKEGSVDFLEMRGHHPTVLALQTGSLFGVQLLHTGY